MVSPITDRRRGLLGSLGFKAPVTALSDSNITLSGEQTIDGKALLAVNAAGVPDRVLCTAQTDSTQNGVWDVSTGAWTRSLDANQNYDFKKGTTVVITDGTAYAGSYWYVSASDPITLGTTLMTWARALASSSAVLSFIQGFASALSRTAQGKLRENVSVLDFIPEALHASIKAGTNTTDLTTYINNAITQVLSVNGGWLYFPGGTYKITSALTILLYTGFKITGESRGSTKILQATDNTPIFKFTKENAHSWYASDLRFEWSNQQVAASTLACAFYFDFDTHTGAGAYNWTAERLAFAKGRNGFAVNTAASNLCWGCTIDQISYEATMVGSCIDFSPNPSAGQPNIRIGAIYARADVIPAAVPVIKLVAADNFSIDHLEINQMLLGCRSLDVSGGSFGRVGVMKSEVGTFTVNNSRLVNLSDCAMTIGWLEIATMTINPGGGNKVFGVYSDGGAQTVLRIDQLHIKQNGAPITSGAFYAITGGATSLRCSIGQIQSLDLATLADQQSSALVSDLTVEDWVTPRLSSDRGDASVTLASGDAPVQRFNTTLTANRTVTLPNAFTASVCGGQPFTVVRNAAVPGAFTLDVGGVKTIPANTNARVTVMYRRFAWELVEYVVLP